MVPEYTGTTLSLVHRQFHNIALAKLEIQMSSRNVLCWHNTTTHTQTYTRYPENPSRTPLSSIHNSITNASEILHSQIWPGQRNPRHRPKAMALVKKRPFIAGSS